MRLLIVATIATACGAGVVPAERPAHIVRERAAPVATSRLILATDRPRVNCADHPSQAAAQAALRLEPTDPDGLDADRDGIACEDNASPRDEDPVPR